MDGDGLDDVADERSERKSAGRHLRQPSNRRCPHQPAGRNGSVARVQVTRPGVRTEAGIQVGDPVGAVEAAYGDRLQRGPAEYDPEGSTLSVNFDDGRKLVYITDGERVTQFSGGRTPEVDFVEGCL
jgi:hypothetical protein